MVIDISIICPNEGVTGFYGMGEVFISYHMCVVNQDFLIIDQCSAYSGLKLSRFIVVLEEA